MTKPKVWNFVLGIWCLFGIWCLVLGIFTITYALNLDNLKVYFLRGDYKQAIAEGEKLIAKNTHAAGYDELYYILALSYLKDGNYLRASDIFEIILNEFKNSSFLQEAKLGLGDTYLLKGDFASAQNYFNELLNSNPDTKLKPLIYFRLSEIGFKIGDTHQGEKYLEKLIQEFPSNLEAKLNKDLCSFTQSSTGSFYTIQVGSFSNITNARNLTQKLIKDGYAAYIEDVSFQGKTTYRVRVGKLNNRKDAINLEKKLIREGYPTHICP